MNSLSSVTIKFTKKEEKETANELQNKQKEAGERILERALRSIPVSETPAYRFRKQGGMSLRKKIMFLRPTGGVH